MYKRQFYHKDIETLVLKIKSDKMIFKVFVLADSIPQFISAWIEEADTQLATSIKTHREEVAQRLAEKKEEIFNPERAKYVQERLLVINGQLEKIDRDWPSAN